MHLSIVFPTPLSPRGYKGVALVNEIAPHSWGFCKHMDMASSEKTVVVQFDKFNGRIKLICSGVEKETDVLMKSVLR